MPNGRGRSSAWVWSSAVTGGEGISSCILRQLERRTQMKVFLAGATGALGRRLIPVLLERGHTVIGTTRSPKKASALSQAGAEPVVLDALDHDAVMRAVVQAEPDATIHQLTALSRLPGLRNPAQ